MKGNAVKIIVFIVLAYFAFLSLKKGIAAFSGRPAQTSVEEEVLLTEELPAEILLSIQEGSAEFGTTDVPDAFASLSDYGNAPFLTQQETRESVQDKTSSFENKSFDTAQLTSIIKYSGQWCAVINSTLVKKGDSMGRLKIADINQNDVTIEESGKTYKLRLWQEATAK